MTSERIILIPFKSKIAMVTFFLDAHFWQVSLVAPHDCMHGGAGGQAEGHVDNPMT